MGNRIAYYKGSPQPGLTYSYYKSDYQRYESAWPAASCNNLDCERCNTLCDNGYIISCDDCGNVYHTDWLGWCGEVDENGGRVVLCPECNEKLAKQ